MGSHRLEDLRPMGVDAEHVRHIAPLRPDSIVELPHLARDLVFRQLRQSCHGGSLLRSATSSSGEGARFAWRLATAEPPHPHPPRRPKRPPLHLEHPKCKSLAWGEALVKSESK